MRTQATMLAEGIQLEADAVKAIQSFARDNEALLKAVWHWGNGYGGGILDIIEDTINKEMKAARELQSNVRAEASKKKKTIKAPLRTKVFERDAYRCVSCGTHISLCCDHIIPESKGGPTTFENLQTMCRSCNSKKGVK
jgi:hypothetical protein